MAKNELDDMPVQLKWEKTHRRPGSGGGYPVSGFADGSYLLYFPDPKPGERVRFKDGVPVVELVPGAMDKPELKRLRDEILEKWVFVGHNAAEAVVEVPFSFMLYATACIREHYEVTDADLEFLLTKSKGWHAGVMSHLVGGEGYLEKLAALRGAMRTLDTTAPAVPSFDFPAAPPAPVKALLWWKRAARRLLRRG